MTQDIQVARSMALPVPADEWSQPALAGGGGVGPQANPLKRLQRLLRGRYLLAAILAGIGAAAGGAAGFLIPKPYFTSTGWIKISPVMINPLGNDGYIPLFQQYLNSEVQIIKSPRVIAGAMTSNEWRAITRKNPSTDPTGDFANSLSVQTSRDSSLVQVTFDDLDPYVAQAAVKAVVNAYVGVHDDMENDQGRSKLTDLEQRQTVLSNKLSRVNLDIKELARDWGTDDLSVIHNAKQLAQEKRKEDWENAAQQLQVVEKLGGEDETGISSLSDYDISRVDRTMEQLLQQQQNAASNIDSLQQTLGSSHRQVIEAKRQLDILNTRIKHYGDEFRKQFLFIVPGMGDEKPKLFSRKDVGTLRDRVKSLENAYVRQKQETADIATQRYQLESKKAERDQLKFDYDNVSRKFDQTDAQFRAAVNSRVVVLSAGELPTSPSVDRRKQMTVLGALGGGSLPLALLVLIGLIDSRYRYSDEANDGISGIPLLGILPNLPDLLTDPEQAAMAAHCVHQIRTLLQISADSQDRRVFCVTSPSPGDGKTSLTLALGLSFATAGSRTLLIDLDLVGAGLSSRMNVNTPEGVLDAITNRSLEPYVQTTEIADLSILPVGRGTARHASMLSPSVVRKLITDARNHFDTVLIDTGPVLGSIEASPVCVSADAVILCVARGQHRPLVEKALNHLMSIGARLSGVVFNRAQARDFEQSVSRNSMRSLRGPVNGNGHGADQAHGDAVGVPQERRAPQLGPVARAVAKSVHSNGDNHG